MTERTKKTTKRHKEDLEKIALARQSGLSALDQLELQDEGDVYDVVDEAQYEKIVEDRRNQSDFVVDDDGIGYYDDGEEHLGVGDDDREMKRRINEAAAEGDNKFAKRARKLAEASSAALPGQKSIFNYVKTGQSSSGATTSKQASNVNPLDIDALMGGFSSSAPARNAIPEPRRQFANVPVAVAAVRRHPQGHSVFDAPQHHVEQQQEQQQYEDAYSGGGDDAGEGYSHYETDAPQQTKSNSDDKENSRAAAQAMDVTTAEEAASSAGDQSQAPADAASAENNIKIEKISLTKSSKKLKIVEPAKPTPAASSATADGKDAKPVLTSLDGNDLGIPGAGFADSSTATEGTVDPRMWLKKRQVAVPAAATEGDAESAAAAAPTTVEEEYLQMYWLDACESNGIIYIFGKVLLNDPGSGSSTGRFVSCTVVVNGAERNLFVLPKATGEFKQDGSPVRSSMGEVYQELRRILVPETIPKSEGQGFRCKQVKRKYAFEHGDVPREECDYLKVVYSARHQAPNARYLNGTGPIERIFGATSSPLELFLLKRKLLGPCWIEIKNPRIISNSVSWCKLEVGVENPKFISKVASGEIPATPPLTSMCVSMKTAVNPATHTHEIVMLSLLVHTKVDADADTEFNPALMRRFTMVRQLGLSCGNSYPAQFPHDLNAEIQRVGKGVIQSFPNERAMLSMFFVRLQQEDPDIMVSHNLFGFEFDVLLARSIANKLPTWSKLGRLRRTRVPKGINDRDIAAGRILCDTYKAAKEFLRETSYSLTSLAQSQLSFDRIEVDPMDVPRFFSSTEDILRLAHHTSMDAMLVQRLMLKLQVIPLTKQLTNLSGNLWTRTIRGARAERIEYLLLHEFHSLKYILPERKGFDNDASNHHAAGDDEEGEGKVGGRSRNRAKAAYSGGLVLEPKKGLYDTYILLLDFNSLYPSIIQEYNLCFTTIEWTKFMGDSKPAANNAAAPAAGKKGKKAAAGGEAGADDADEDEEEGPENEEDPTSGAKALPPIPENSAQPGVLPRVIRNLVDRRKGVKSLLKKERDPIVRQQLDIRQKALKLTANSMYGCLGFTFSRFYARPIAALVTAKGREALQRTVDQATNQMGLDIIYGDTDSVMINTNSTDLPAVKEVGNLVKREVNKLYKALELDIDGIFKSMLLLKKKKYAALVIKETDKGVEYEKEMKGLDLVRRDWCILSRETGKYVVDQILSGKPREEIVMTVHDHLSDLATKVRGGELDLSKFIITKGLNKNPKDYPDCKGQAHLQVALAMLKANKPVNIGDHIPYIICVQGPEGAQAPQRAYHPDEVARSNGALTVDYEWYLANQILPPISRLCEPIEGTSAAILSTKLGLDASKYARTSGAGDEGMDDQWAFTPRCLMDDSERFKECALLECQCLTCQKQTYFPGVIGPSGVSGLNCTECGAMYLGRRNAADIYSYLSNRVSLLVRQSLKRYYDCWLVCDDPTCGRRTMQQSAMGYTCTEDCHGRMVQEYDDVAVYNQLKYLESLFDVPRAVKIYSQQAQDSNESSNRINSAENIPVDHREVFRLLKEHMSNTVVNSAYNWVRPSLWTAVFGKLLTPATTSS